MRKLASIQRVLNIYPIEGADRIEVAQINGWKVIQKKGESKVGDLVVYFEIDSFLPVRPEFEFLRATSLKVMEGVEGYRIKTRKLKGVVSQGLVLPLDAFPWDNHPSLQTCGYGVFEEGMDVTELLGVKKYEVAEIHQGFTRTKGNFPHFIPKTDQTRIQNRPSLLEDRKTVWEVTLKMDGSSMTVYHKDGDVGVCSRNLELTIDDETKAGNHFVKTAVELDLLERLKEAGRNVAVQGELMGPGIQGNREGLAVHHYFIYDVWDIDAMRYMSVAERVQFLTSVFPEVYETEEIGMHVARNATQRLRHCPAVSFTYDGGGSSTFDEMVNDAETKATECFVPGVYTVEDLLALADAPSLNHPVAEGFVFKSMDGQTSFKVINNKYLLKCEA